MAYQLTDEDRRIAQQMAMQRLGQMRPQAQPQQSKKGFWTDQISTGGGIGGALGGAATGAAIGSVVPGIGTAIGGLAGGILGGALGSGGGEMVENRITGDDLWKNVGKEAALGGVFSAPPVRVGKGLAQGGLGLVKGGGGSAVKKSLEQALTEPGMLTKLGQGAGGAADNMAIKQFRLTPSQLTNFKKKFGEDAGQTIRKYGFSTVDDVTTKGIDPLQEQFGQVLTGIPGVTKQALKESFDSKISTLTKSAASDNKALGKQLKSEADAVLKRYGDVIDAKDLNQIRREFDSLVNYTQQQANPARYGVNKRMADAIRETLQKSDPSGQLKDVGMEISKLKQLADNVARQDNLGRGSSPLGMLNLLGGIAGGVPGGAPGAMAGAALAGAANSRTGRRAIMSGAERVGNAANRAAQSQVNPMGARQVATRLGTVGAVGGAMNSQPTTLEDDLTGQSSFENMANPNAMPTTSSPINAPPMTSNMAQSYQETPQMSSPYGRENLLYDIQRDPANAQEYIQYYQMLQEVFAPQAEEAKPLTQGQQERADLIRALDLTESAIEGGSINYGPIGSRIEGIKSAFNAADPETLSYKNTISGLRAAITKARAGASLTAGELKMLQQYTPSDTDSEQVVRSKLAALRSLYGYSMPVGGNDGTLEGVLTGGGY